MDVSTIVTQGLMDLFVFVIETEEYKELTNTESHADRAVNLTRTMDAFQCHIHELGIFIKTTTRSF